ncbi:hypothetical protein ACQEVB_12955 [Pseudonocardia sp. CA-107938]|uniref:hypothetical protein n=1 Tax=Pseudonocardia sp. CA-107938 TaxID=3240021 RepID=UPI003D94E6D7
MQGGRVRTGVGSPSVVATVAGVAAMVTIAGTVLPLDVAAVDGRRYTTAWTGPGSATGIPLYGIPLTLTALVLIAAAVLMLRRSRRGAVAAVTAAAGLLVGLVVTIRLAASATARNVELQRSRFPDLQAVDTPGIGAWLLMVAAVLAVVAAVLAPRALRGDDNEPPGGSRPGAALVAVLAAALAVVGSFLAITVTTFAGNPPSVGYATGWSFAVEPGPPGDAGQATALVGVPLVIAAAALLLGALIVLDMRGAERAAPLLTVAAGVVAGVFVAIWIAWLALVDAQSIADIGITTTLGAGAWVLLAATLVAAGLCVVLWLQPRRP